MMNKANHDSVVFDNESLNKNANWKAKTYYKPVVAAYTNCEK
jgi:hypothetical protein